jgi:quinol monooxygenase YgiN
LIYLKIRVRINPNKQTEFRQAVTQILNDDYSEEGCLKFDITRSLDDSTLYLYTEEWADTETLQKHLNTDQFHSLLGAMKVLGDIVDSRIIKFESEEQIVL